ncbi:MAG TPA: hypothetical protein VNY05_29455 [Candidatus Acidoferrales bacterium]|nr:hypothetical protein [Candidatus Acidoferrales bacterium]
MPIIIGTCKDETAWLIGNRDASTFTLDEASLRSKLADNLALPKSDIEELIDIYRKAHPDAKTPSDLFFLTTSDRGTRMNAISQAERKTEQNQAPAYMYYFTYNTPILDGRYRRSTPRSCRSSYGWFDIPMRRISPNIWLRLGLHLPVPAIRTIQTDPPHTLVR